VNAIILTPDIHGEILGNNITAERWAGVLRALGHDVVIAGQWNNAHCDLLIALHARHSHSSVTRFRQAHANRPLIVALTGTDLYRDLPNSIEAQQSLSMATRVIVLQSAALERLSNEICAKTSVIYQSALPPAERPKPREDCFEVCVMSHLREVKDPLRAAFASRLLPRSSTIRIVHAGRALEPEWAETARREDSNNARYSWVEAQSHESVLQLLSRCRLLVLSSTMEGGANAIAEAVVCGIPVLCSEIPGNIGMLGREYSGYFRVADTEQLAEMLYRAESDPEFLGRLQEFVHNLKDRFSPERESASWRQLLQSEFPKYDSGGLN
jgi:putative glycosyltransferase (TIGR04348 family)